MTTTVMVNARVESDLVEEVKQVLAAAGMTLSEGIRAAFAQIARTGVAPKAPIAEVDEAALARAKELTMRIESLSASTTQERPEGWGDVELDKQILGEERMARFGS